jgi:hypothetical protein
MNIPNIHRFRLANDNFYPNLGYSTAETAIAMAIVGLLSSAGMAMIDFGSQDLTVVGQEFQASLHEAFHLAWAQGRDVIVALGDPKTPGIIPVKLPPRVKWGKPGFIPAPPGMEEPKRAGTSGSAHPRITVTARHTATACAWFVNDGKEAICMRLSGHGHIQVLRWRRSTKKWHLC